MEKRCAAAIETPVAALFGIEMILTGLAINYFPSAGYLEPFRVRFICFDHVISLFIFFLSRRLGL